MELAWDLVRTIADQAECGMATSYIDEMCQRFFVQDGYICTEIGFLDEGHWESVDFEDMKIISDAGYSLLDFDHGFNGHVMVVGQHGNDVVFMMYEYMATVSSSDSFNSCLMIKAPKAIRLSTAGLLVRLPTKFSAYFLSTRSQGMICASLTQRLSENILAPLKPPGKS